MSTTTAPMRACIAGLAAIASSPRWTGPPRNQRRRSHVDAHGQLQEEDKTGPEGLLALSAAQIDAAKITLGKVGPGLIVRHLTVPGTVVADADRLAHVAAKVAGTIGE